MPAPTAERPLREWPMEQLVEQAALHAADAAALGALALEVRHRRGLKAKALEVRLAAMIATCAAVAPPVLDPVPRLRSMLAAAAQEITALRARLAVLEAAAGEPGPHRRIHLTPDAPAWLVTAVRRAYRRRYHPDTAADQQHRRRAEEVFKRAEAVFEAIERLR